MTATTDKPVEISAEIAYAIFMSEQRINASRDERNTPEERREHARQVRALDKAASEMLAGNIPQPVNIAGARGVYFVRSRTSAGTVYRVSTRGGDCTCEARGDCWHMAASLVCEEVAEGERALAEFLALYASARAETATEADEARLLILDSHSYIAYIKRIAPERLAIPEPDEDIPLSDYAGEPDEDAIFAAVLEHEQAPEPLDYENPALSDEQREAARAAHELAEMGEAYAYEHDEPDAGIYPARERSSFRGDIGI